MTNDDIERIVSAIVFIFGLAGVFYKMKSRVDQHNAKIAKIEEDLEKHSKKLESLTDLEVLKNQMKTVFNMLEKQSESFDKGQDKVLKHIEKLFDKLDGKKDKD